MKKMKKILCLLLVFAMTFGCMSGMVSAAEMTWGTKPEDGVTEDQPFASGTGGSTNFRIPCLVSLDDGTIVAACDARWNHSSDACGLDTIVSRSTDYGKTWNYTFANYLGDNGNIFSYNSTAFIDPAIATDGETVWMIADIYPAGVAINTVPSTHNARPGHTGYDENHNLVLAKATDTVNGLSATNDRIAQPFDYHLEKIEGAADNAESYYNLIDASGNVVEGYAIDAFFNIKGNGADTNLFCGDSPYFPWPTDFLYMTSSTDGGATWSIPTLIDVKRADEQTLLVGPGRGIVTSEGRIVFTAYDFTYGDDKSCAIYSDDGGKTWTRGADVAAWSSESVVTEADGKLYLFTRHGNAYYVSSDWGETWGPQISTGLTYNSNCQVTAITYSEKIDGKTAILFAAPSSTSSRANGKIFVGLVREDTTIEWVKEFNVCEGGASYAYSCLTELANGDIGLLWENQGASIRYDSYTMDEILGYVKNITIDPEEVYTEEFAADGVVEIAQAPNEKVATVTSEYVVEDATTLLHDHASNTASSLNSFSATANVANSLADAEVVLTNVEGNAYKAYNAATGKYVYKAESSPHVQLADSADDAGYQLALEPTTAEDGSVTYKMYRASSSSRYTMFYYTNMDFNTWGAYNDSGKAKGDYELVLLEKQETVSDTDVIPGYARAAAITSGNTYLITYIWTDGSVIVLDPTEGSTGAQTKLVGDTVTVAKNTVTITGVAPGKTTAVVGDITYNITVEDPTTRPDYAGNDLSTEGMKLTAGSLEPTEGSLEALLDGDSDSFYHSNWSGTRPTDADFWITIELPEVTEVSGMRYLPRQSSANGRILSYEISYSVDGETWTVAASGDWADDNTWKAARFDENVEAKYVKIFATDSKADTGGRHMTAAELRVLKAVESVEPSVPVDKTALKALVDACAELDMSVYTEESAAALAAAVEAAQAVLDNEAATPADVYVAVEALEAAKAALEEIPTTPVVDPADDSRDVPVEMYKATAGSTQPGGSPNQALDSDPNSFWEVAWDIGNTNPEVMWYQIELADEVEIDAVRYLPRWGESAGSTNGFVTQYLIQISTDGENWTTVAEGNWERTEGWKIAEFEAVTAKYVRMTGVGTWADVGENSNMSIAEIRVRATGEVINKGALKAAIAKAEGLAAEDYVDLNGIAAPLAAAKAVAAKADATQEEVDETTKALNDAVAALVKIVKKDALKAAIADAKEVDQDLYTSTTAKALADAIAAGEALVKDSEATQEAVDAAAAAISKAKAALKAKATEEEKAALQEAVDAAEAMDKAGYTEESVAELDEAIAAAKAVLDDADATSKDVKDAADDLQDAVDALEIPVVEDEVVRLFGQGRYDTAYAVANELKEVLGVEKFEAVVVATGKNFADALAGSYLAVEKDAPILLTNGKDDNVAELHAYIAANVAEGGKVYILGGEAAVPAAVEAVEGYEVERLFGDSRYDTNLAILEEAGISGDSVIVATGKTFADSLSASAAKLPILLVKPDGTLNDAQKAVLTGMKNIYIVGGDGAVSASYEAELKEFGTVTRVFGESRYDTSVEVAKTFCKDVDKAVVASGKNFPDGLCGGPLAAALNAPLVLTKDGVAAAAAAYVAENGIASGYVLGGDGALTDATVVEVFALESAEEIK